MPTSTPFLYGVTDKPLYWGGRSSNAHAYSRETLADSSTSYKTISPHIIRSKGLAYLGWIDRDGCNGHNEIFVWNTDTARGCYLSKWSKPSTGLYTHKKGMGSGFWGATSTRHSRVGKSEGGPALILLPCCGSPSKEREREGKMLNGIWMATVPSPTFSRRH